MLGGELWELIDHILEYHLVGNNTYIVVVVVVIIIIVQVLEGRGGIILWVSRRRELCLLIRNGYCSNLLIFNIKKGIRGIPNNTRLEYYSLSLRGIREEGRDRQAMGK